MFIELCFNDKQKSRPLDLITLNEGTENYKMMFLMYINHLPINSKN